MHFNFNQTIALAIFTATAFDIETKPAGANNRGAWLLLFWRTGRESA